MAFKRRFKDKCAGSLRERICCPISVRLVKGKKLSNDIVFNGTMSDDEPCGTCSLLTDEIIERANKGCHRGAVEERCEEEGPYIVQGDIAMTKEQYEEYMADWKKQEAELIAKGEIKPPK